MSRFESDKQELLKTVLEPLLEDFAKWFTRSRSFLESHEIDFLSEEAQSQLLERVITAQQEVQAAQVLFQATSAQVGIEPNLLFPWHTLVTECWEISRRWHAQHSVTITASSPVGRD